MQYISEAHKRLQCRIHYLGIKRAKTHSHFHKEDSHITMAMTIKDFSESLPLLLVLHEDITSWNTLERVTIHTGESQTKIYTTYHNSRRIRWHKGASLSLYVIFVYIPTPLSFLRIERLPISRIPVAVQFLTSARCCMLHVGQDYNALQSQNQHVAYYTLSLAVVQSQTPAD